MRKSTLLAMLAPLSLILLLLFSTPTADFTSLMQNKVWPQFPTLGFDITWNSLKITEAPRCLVAFSVGQQPRWIKALEILLPP